MTRSESRSPSRSSTQPDPSVHSPANRLIGEVIWLVRLSLALALIGCLFSYHAQDPGWSHVAQADTIHNLGGRLGAWIADLMLFIFGFSAYWWCALLLRNVLLGWRKLHQGTPLPVRSILHWIGFTLILVASMGIESTRLQTWHQHLPSVPGGVLGETIGIWLQMLIGATGTTLLLLLSFIAGLSLFFQFSWLSVAEQMGAAIENSFFALWHLYERRRDRKLGEVAAAGREETLVEHRVKIEEAQPIHIIRPVTQAPHEKVVQEKQTSLFGDTTNTALPPYSLLDPPPVQQHTISSQTMEFTSRLIEKKLHDFGVEVQVVAAHPGPVITRYEIEPATGIKGSQIVNLAKDLARSLSLISLRVVETSPGKTTMGLELPNPKRQNVHLSEILGSEVFNNSHSLLTLALGKDIAGKPMVADLARMPHCLVAGTTGAGKSVGINAMILSLLYKATPEEVRLIMIDPKMLELSIYEGIPHLLCPVVTDMRQAGSALNWAVAEMERRYKLMSTLGVRNLAGYNKKIHDAQARGEHLNNPVSLTPDAPEPLKKLPMIVILIDELADLMMVVGKKVEELIARIAQKARAAGVHLILATQRPSVDVITGLIKANVPTRISFQVSSKIDSRTILDQMGAEALLGMGDMLFLAPGTGLPIRVHGAFVSDEEVHRVVEYLRAQGEPNYIEGILDASEDGAADGEAGTGGNGEGEADPLYDQAVAIILKNRRASISLVQRHLRIGYNRAARLLEDMEKAGLVSAMSGSGNRDILVPGEKE
ncbi:MAG: DNA translocase FtsK 4TM domain-containing protein [Ottowia sp.]|nr:DNA translocase FtsK 4TM domain-containing protein [Ottowia sp.]